MNLLNDPWIPVQRKNGTQDVIAPWQISDPDIIFINSPRPDFDGALIQFLIGLFQTIMTPKDNSSWENLLDNPPTENELKNKMQGYSELFELNGKIRFMQDQEDLKGKLWSINRLLIDSPGDNALLQNRDHFLKRNLINKLCPCCASSSLFTFQLYTQGFGAGHRVSLRGKGPLTSIVVPDTQRNDIGDSIWIRVWLNVLDQKWISVYTVNSDKNELVDIFPWAGKTRCSFSKKEKNKTVYINSGQGTTPIDAHLYQSFWPMPCRINLNFSELSSGDCDICNNHSDGLISNFRISKHGVDYIEGWKNTLTPSSTLKNGKIVPYRIKAGGMVYTHWLGLVEKTDFLQPSLVAERFLSLAFEYKEQYRLQNFGFEIDQKNKARSWHDATFPLLSISDDIHHEFSDRIRRLTVAADEFAGFINTCIKEAWYDSDPKKNKNQKKGINDKILMTGIRESFFSQTEGAFFLKIDETLKSINDQFDKSLLNKWHMILYKSAIETFEKWILQTNFYQANPRRIAEARKKLGNLSYSKKIRDLLLLPKTAKE